MLIGIIGSRGIVGGAVKYGMLKLGHEVKEHDILLDTKIEDILNTDIVYICVPTPSSDTGKCDTSIVENIVAKLNDLQYMGVIAIKSTVEPGTTNKLIDKYMSLRLAFVPEFLRERCAISDFTENHDVCIIGSKCHDIVKLITKSHGKYPKEFIQMEPIEAELAKYFNNIYNATLITFANAFYNACKSMGADYTSIKNAMTHRPHINDVYLDCNENFRGFGGACLPKDTKAIAYLCSQLDDTTFFDDLLKQNNKYKITILEGMREK